MTENRFALFTERSVKTGIFIFMAFPVLSNLLYTLGGMFQQDALQSGLSVLAFLLLTIAFLALAAGIKKSKKLLRLGEKRFLLLAAGWSVFTGIISIALIDSKLDGDFLLYHEAATRIVQGEYDFSHVLTNITNLYIRRALFNLVPFYLLPGPDLVTIQIANLFLNLATGLMLYEVVRYSLRSPLTARMSLIIFFLIPITYLTLNIPSHDIAGLFWLMLCFFVFRWVHQWVAEGKIGFRVLLLASSLGPLMLVLQFSRSMGIFIFYSLGIMLAFRVLSLLNGATKFSDRKWIHGTLIMYVLPLTLYFVLNTLANPGNISRGSARMMFISNDTSPENQGAFDDIFDYRRYYNLIGAEERESMARGKLASEIYYNYSDYLRLLVRKSNHLFSLGEDMTWARTENPLPLDRTVNMVFLPINRAFRILLFGLAMIGLLALLKKYKLSNPIFLLLLTGMLCSVLLIIFGEINPRYSYLFIPHLTVLAAAGFTGLPGFARRSWETVVNRPAALIRQSFPVLAVICAACLMLIGLKPISARVFGKSEQVYRDLGNALVFIQDDTENTADAAIPMIPKEKALKFGLKTLPGQQKAEASWKFAVDPGHNYTIRGFVRENSSLSKDTATMVFADDVMIFPGGESQGGARLKYKKGYTVDYFSFSPIFVQKDTIHIRMVVTTREGESFLEFLQIVKTDPERGE